MLTTGFDKDEIFVVGTERCTLSELEIYLINIQKTYENVFGEEIWDVTSDGVTFEESIKNTALAQIAQVKTMYLMALDRGLELDEEEKVEPAEHAEETETAETEEAACKDKKENSEEENSEEENACKDKKNAEEAEEETACKDKKNAELETATVYVDEHQVEVHEQSAYDTETGKSINQRVVIETSTSQPVDGTLIETVDGVHVAEVKEDNDPAQAPETVEPSETNEVTETPVETPAEPTNETPAESNPDDPGDNPPEVVAGEKTTEQMIAELVEIINGLKSEIAELKEHKHTAEAKTVTADINPFMDTLKTEAKYSLLEKDEKVSSYSLLSK